ncbi:30S ribosomal protein S2 [Candidatus Kaiserbacteria bacterium]|nr:30S ribosomal protein S2 [Candidatus Kaiserbacteria bacterium]USN88935.1 MAG: 30S ribosomal protein S2 [Candidatus Nomurabacteria bacterium]
MSTNNPTFIDRLFKAGAHFGFKKSRRHPSVAPYLYTTKDGSDIFDLEKVTALLDTAKETIKEAGLHGKTVLFVSTKDEASKLVKAAAEKVEAPYVTNRWIGGMLTNFSEIKKRINRLEALTHEKESGELERKYTKKERVVIGREIDKLSFNFFGISKITRMPDLMVVVDPRHDEIAVTEALDKGIATMAIMSSDCDASKITYPVVVNDSLQSSVSLILDELVASYEEGKAAYVPKAPEPRKSAPRR